HLHLTPDERASAVVYTSGEHCPMCAAAHAFVGLGRVVYVASTAQFERWKEEAGVDKGPVAALPISAVAPRVRVAGPVAGLDLEVKALYQQWWERRKLKTQAGNEG
ncbi:hypothetical protein BBK36DRAFT_1131333, partial [Trichoderma citrinoviride]